MLQYFFKRRSIRLFTAEKVQDETIKHILQAGMLAPTGQGKKSVEYIVVTDETKIRDLVGVKKHGFKPLKTATLAIIVLGDSSSTDTWIEDASLATVFMQLEVTALGLGSTWVQVDKRTTPTEQNSADFLRQRFDFPKHLQPLCILAIGHKAEEPSPYTDAAFDFTKVHYEQY